MSDTYASSIPVPSEQASQMLWNIVLNSLVQQENRIQSLVKQIAELATPTTPALGYDQPNPFKVNPYHISNVQASTAHNVIPSQDQLFPEEIPGTIHTTAPTIPLSAITALQEREIKLLSELENLPEVNNVLIALKDISPGENYFHPDWLDPVRELIFKTMKSLLSRYLNKVFEDISAAVPGNPEKVNTSED